MLIQHSVKIWLPVPNSVVSTASWLVGFSKRNDKQRLNIVIKIEQCLCVHQYNMEMISRLWSGYWIGQNGECVSRLWLAILGCSNQKLFVTALPSNWQQTLAVVKHALQMVLYRKWMPFCQYRALHPLQLAFVVDEYGVPVNRQRCGNLIIIKASISVIRWALKYTLFQKNVNCSYCALNWICLPWL